MESRNQLESRMKADDDAVNHPAAKEENGV